MSKPQRNAGHLGATSQDLLVSQTAQKASTNPGFKSAVDYAERQLWCLCCQSWLSYATCYGDFDLQRRKACINAEITSASGHLIALIDHTMKTFLLWTSDLQHQFALCVSPPQVPHSMFHHCPVETKRDRSTVQ